MHIGFLSTKKIRLIRFLRPSVPFGGSAGRHAQTRQPSCGMGDAIGTADSPCSPTMLLAEGAKCQESGDSVPGLCLLSIRQYAKTG